MKHSLLFLLITGLLINILTACHHEKPAPVNSPNVFMYNVFNDYQAIIQADITNTDNSCQAIAKKHDYWQHNKKKSNDKICVLNSNPDYEDEFGSWEIQAEWGTVGWGKITYNICGNNFTLQNGKCIENKVANGTNNLGDTASSSSGVGTSSTSSSSSSTSSSSGSNTTTKNDSDYLGSEYAGNYVWGGAMNLAWNELNDNILQEKLKLNTDNTTALAMVEKLNKASFSKKDLDEASYYIKSGYGQETVNLINTESKQKFLNKSFADLNLQLSSEDIISYAYFAKTVEYAKKFTASKINFNGQEVAGFTADNKDQKDNVKIIKYESDNKFIISLSLKDNNDQLILAKGYDMNNPKEIVNEFKISKIFKTNSTSIDDIDQFKAPQLALDHHRDYQELIGKNLANSKFTSYVIATMFENIKFNMNEVGAKVENEGAIVAVKSLALPDNTKQPKQLILDQPYWVIMVRANSNNPYFILGVKNNNLMTK